MDIVQWNKKAIMRQLARRAGKWRKRSADEIYEKVEDRIDDKGSPAKAGKSPHMVTGAMRASLKTADERYESIVYSDDKKGLYHEFGTKNEAPHPWFSIGIRAAKAKIKALAKGIIE